MRMLFGFDIGGTKCAVLLGKVDGKQICVLERSTFPTKTCAGPEDAIARMAQEAETLAERHSCRAQISGAGVSCGGPLDSAKGLILSPPNLPGWDSVPIGKELTERLGVPVKLQNDANACALAEWKFGAGRGCQDMAFLTFGTGLGAGFILNGQLYEGACGMAGEVGHMRLSEHGPVGYGKEGSFEGFCSGGGIAQLAKTKVLEQLQAGKSVSFCRNMGELETLNAKTVGDAAECGDALALEIYRISGQYLGRGLAVLIDILNLEAIVIGSIFARSHDLLWPEAEKVIRREALCSSGELCRVVPAQLGESLGDIAALSAAL